tara:strand:+ start:396 stop:512 length:117 start_codon:yes stop_codon:yes gene_type:complete
MKPMNDNRKENLDRIFKKLFVSLSEAQSEVFDSDLEEE